MKSPEKTRTIYGLCCPDTGTVMYVGMTVNPEIRLRTHIAESEQSAYWVSREAEEIQP
jgi:hypothetical protein